MTVYLLKCDKLNIRQKDSFENCRNALSGAILLIRLLKTFKRIFTVYKPKSV